MEDAKGALCAFETQQDRDTYEPTETVAASIGLAQGQADGVSELRGEVCISFHL